MLIGGLQKTTLIDYPSKVACSVFTVGCNFRCPFCHNKDLVNLQNFQFSNLPKISEKEFFDFLKKRKKILDGVCITGGEPTIQSDLINFCQKIKKHDLLIKLDTNGSSPQVLRDLIKSKLLDYVAVDIKTAFDEYEKAVNSQFSISNLQKSIKEILVSKLSHEFRTTVVPGIHNKENLIKLAKDLRSLVPSCRLSSTLYYLQNFRPQNCLDPKFLKVKPFSGSQMQEFLLVIRKYLPQARLRN